jgi:hypothetical protein
MWRVARWQALRLAALIVCGLGAGAVAACTDSDATGAGPEATPTDVAPTDASDLDAAAADAPLEDAGGAPLDAADGASSGAETAAALCARVAGLCEVSAADGPALGERLLVAPSDQMPPEVVSQTAHNNLDMLWHDGRLWVAFRTARFHYADAGTRLYVVSSEDLDTWRFEGEFHLDTDLREPQLVAIDGGLWLYFAVLGDNPIAFEPQGTRRAAWLAPGSWTTPEPVFEGDFLAWRIQPRAGRIEATGYRGGGGVYDLSSDPIRVQWLASDDGAQWEAAVTGTPTVWEGGASEMDLVVHDDGSVVAVMRNEAGDVDGFGSYVCRGEAAAPADWTCAYDPKKYDSPRMFRHGDQTFLLARRNVTETGHYDTGRDDLDRSEQYLQYQLDYWGTPKRCALWQVDAEALEVTHVLDLPTRGDTCFPEIEPLGDGRYLIADYTSPPDGEDLAWQPAQVGQTQVYLIVLALP